MALSDLDGVLEYVNPAFERVTGYAAEEILGDTFRRLQSGVHDQAFYDELKRTLRSGQVWRGHFVNRKKNGELYHEEATISPVRDEEGRATGYLAVKKDITRELELAAELAAAREAAARSEVEREVLDQTVAGSVRMLMEVLSMVRASVFGRSARIANHVVAACRVLKVDDWDLRMAAMLSEIGTVAIPAEVVEKALLGLELTPEEASLFDSHPAIGVQLLSSVPRLERVAAIVDRSFGHRRPSDEPAGGEANGNADGRSRLSVRTAAQYLRAARVFDRALQKRLGRIQANRELQSVDPPLPSEIVRALATVPIGAETSRLCAVALSELTPGMHLEQDIVSNRGTLLMRGGQEITLSLVSHLRRIASAHPAREPIKVRVPVYRGGARDSADLRA